MLSEFLTLALLVLLSAVFSASETALISLSASKVDELVSNKVRNSKRLKKLKSDPHKLLITILIGNNIVNVAASVIATVAFTNLFDSAGIGIATGVMTLMLLIFGEITPKAFGHQHAVGFSLFIARPIQLLQFVLYPLVMFFDFIVYGVNKMVGSQKHNTVTEGEIVAMLKIGAQEGSIEKQEKELIENVLEFNDIKVDEIMTPRVQIEALDQEMTIKEAVDYAISHSHTRLPVYKKDLDNIIGIISIKKLLKYSREFGEQKDKKISDMEIIPPIEVPESKKINKLFREFQRKHEHIAIVIDEHGGTAGLITMEDIIEEIVGDIEDETDQTAKPITVITRNKIQVQGSIWMEDVNDFFKLEVGDDRDTLNSTVTEHLGRFPREGETINFNNIKIEILRMKEHIIDSAVITRRKTKKV